MQIGVTVAETIYLFLDFDGVLHHDCVYRNRDGKIYIPIEGRELFEHAHCLAGLLQPYPEVQIVLSTSWVSTLGSYSKVRERMPESLANRVIGATWHSALNPEWFFYATRYEQVIAAVKRDRRDRWIALDNDAEGWAKEHRWHLVHTNDDHGISERRKQEELVEKIEFLRIR